jgi:hypothetical protein
MGDVRKTGILRRGLRVADTLLTTLGVVQLLGRAAGALNRSRGRPEGWRQVVEESHAVELYLKAAAGAARTTGVLGYEALREAARHHRHAAG